MPRIGYSNPYIAKYTANGAGKVGYSDGLRLGRGVNRTTTVENGSTNDFYADNKLAETSGGVFSSGELSVAVAELTAESGKAILGLQEKEIEVNGKKEKVIAYNDNMKAPLLGYGDIIKQRINGVDSWVAAILPKIQFNIPEDAATTQGAEIDWQTSTVTAKIMRDDTADHNWKYEKTYSSESEADSFIRHFLGIEDNALESLTVSSVAGTAVGDTAITVTEPLTDGRTYRYKVGSSVDLPALYDSLSDWSIWDGTSDITAASGDTICIAEVDTLGLVLAAGTATVVSKA